MSKVKFKKKKTEKQIKPKEERLIGERCSSVSVSLTGILTVMPQGNAHGYTLLPLTPLPLFKSTDFYDSYEL